MGNCFKKSEWIYGDDTFDNLESNKIIKINNIKFKFNDDVLCNIQSVLYCSDKNNILEYPYVEISEYKYDCPYNELVIIYKINKIWYYSDKTIKYKNNIMRINLYKPTNLKYDELYKIKYYIGCRSRCKKYRFIKFCGRTNKIERLVSYTNSFIIKDDKYKDTIKWSKIVWK